ncbi:sex comb on midleg-like protein 4 isoform X12 [Papio anubis]|uniref:sex comb on midleg-like protein 4 isoform X12 n=1 Tax=Papio anubis TaxID=9555 RepID=UPI000B7B6D4C|nr:sex comb on midleg-like protein 4 isoform X12 [Papio anubis]
MEIHCCSYAPLLPVSDLSPHSVRLAPAEMQSQRIPGRKRGRPSLHSTPMKMAVHNLYSASAGSLPAVKIPKKRGRKPGYKIKSRVLMTPLALSPPRSTPEPDLSSIPQDAATVPSLAAPQALTVCLYINKQANAGPYLERRKVQQLPEHFGPERPSAVLQQAVQACIDCAHQQKLVFSLVKQGYGGEMVSVSASFDGKQHLRSLPVVNSVGYVLRFLAKLCRSLLCDDLFSHQPFPRGCSASEKVQEKEEGRMESGASVKGCTQGRKPSVSVTRKSLRDSQQKAPLHPTAPSTCWKPGVPQRRAGEAAGWRRHNHQAKTVTTEEYLVNPVGMNRYGKEKEVQEKGNQVLSQHLTSMVFKACVFQNNPRGFQIVPDDFQGSKRWRRWNKSRQDSSLKPFSGCAGCQAATEQEPLRLDCGGRGVVCEGRRPAGSGASRGALQKARMRVEIDGNALLLLKSDMVMKYLGLKLGPALKLCYHIDKLKQAKF